MLARLRISVPDLPGALGRVASAIGTAGADIAKVDVLENEAGRALDDVFVEVRDAAHVERVRDRLTGVAGVRVSGIQLGVPPAGGHTDLELVAQVIAFPERGLRTLVDGAPGALGADWAAVIAFDDHGAPGEVVAVSPQAPGSDHVVVVAPRRLASLRMTPPGADQPYGGTALVPLGTAPLGLVLVRATGPDFHRLELWRLEQLGKVIGSVLSVAVAAG
ncbi:MAG TPA: ACT domain-containing protein [Kineosporiaceae bacterium]|nr:ACT domain-containing protein [Kineosporiaceae bacterium]